MKISDLGEFRLIDLIRRSAPALKSVVRGIGDDTAVLQFNSREYLLFTTDMLVEGVHFFSGTAGQLIGHKALACNISDIAAMGGTPTYAVVSLGVSADTDLKLVKAIYSGINTLARKFNVAIVGGDTVKSQKLVINIALLGRVAKKHLVTRGNARPDDLIFTTGPLGRSLPTVKHLSFIPRVAESQFLVKYAKPSAMIDISDGLSADLGHILEESRVGATIYEGLIPRNPGATLKNSLMDGEDFELLFTVPFRNAQRLKAASGKFRFFEIGFVSQEKGLRLVGRDSRKRSIVPKGFRHF